MDSLYFPVAVTRRQLIRYSVEIVESQSSFTFLPFWKEDPVSFPFAFMYISSVENGVVWRKISLVTKFCKSATVTTFFPFFTLHMLTPLSTLIFVASRLRHASNPCDIFEISRDEAFIFYHMLFLLSKSIMRAFHLNYSIFGNRLFSSFSGK